MSGQRTKKLLRFGTDQPTCYTCSASDVATLCRRRVDNCDVIVCRNCNSKSKQFTEKAAAQKARRFSDANYRKPACVICLEPTLQVLELDHLAGAANSDLIEPLCANCHATKSDAAEHDPMASLRLRDPQRSALALQAAFEFGLAAVLGAIAVIDGADGETARTVFFGLVAAVLIAWALWNLEADVHLARILGSGYDHAIAAPVPK